MKQTIIKILKNLERGWKIYISPPKETRIFFNHQNAPILSEKVAITKTKSEPKQVVIDSYHQRAYVTCMKDRVLQEFSYAENNLILTNQWEFPEQCVEIEFVNGLCFLTTTNFKRGIQQKSHFWIFNPRNGKVISHIDTKGEWSKVIKIDDIRGIAYVSNWHSHNLSIIDINDLQNPKIIQILACSESPRGLALKSDGVVIATSFYSRKIFSIKKNNEKYFIDKESTQFDPDAYGGNMRDIIISQDDKIAWVSNLGRNMLHRYDAQTIELLDSVLVSKQPNSIRFLDETENIILVSCRKDNIICFIDTKEKKPIGISQQTGKFPTGLAIIKGGFLVTSFDDSTIELHKVRYD